MQPLLFLLSQLFTPMTDATPRRSACSRLLDRAMRILAMRDHSEQELRRKLGAVLPGKNEDEQAQATPEDIEKVIAWCHEQRYLDDEHFAERYIASRATKATARSVFVRSYSKKAFHARRAMPPLPLAKLTGKPRPVNRPSVNSARRCRAPFRKKRKCSAFCCIAAITWKISRRSTEILSDDPMRGFTSL